MKTIALIPARGGSRGILRKNLVPLMGKPLIAWTIEQALAIDALDHVIVSTEDAEIARVAREYGAETPFVRPAELATDHAGSMDVFIHCARWLRDETSNIPDYILVLPVTSPLRTEQDILAALEIAHKQDADMVIGVTPVAEHPYWVRRIDEQERLRPFIADTPEITHRQDLPPAYALNGAVYLYRMDVLLNKNGKSDNVYPLVMPREHSVDINTPFDLELVELLLQHRQA